jgi:hypothetical protein
VEHPREVAVTPEGEDERVGKVMRVKITLAGGREVESESPPDVPMRTDTLVLLRSTIS